MKTDMLEPETKSNLPAPITPMAMLQLAVEKGADLTVIQQFMDLNDRWEASQARKAYVSAMNNFKADPPTLEKNKHVKFGNTEYDHATLDQVCDVIGSALARHGLFHRWDVKQHEHDVIEVACLITHALGHSERVSLSAKPDASGSKNPIQAIGSAVTYLQRYTLLSATGLAAREQDDDGKNAGGGATISDEQKAEIVELLRETGSNVKAFLDYMKAPTVDELPAAKFASAKAALEKKRKGKS